MRRRWSGRRRTAPGCSAAAGSLDRRPAEIYGGLSFTQLEQRIGRFARELGLGVQFFQSDFEGEYDEEELPVSAERRPGVLEVEGAVGPECHPYGSTALQLYMRKREMGGDSPPASVESAP